MRHHKFPNSFNRLSNLSGYQKHGWFCYLTFWNHFSCTCLVLLLTYQCISSGNCLTIISHAWHFRLLKLNLENRHCFLIAVCILKCVYFEWYLCVILAQLNFIFCLLHKSWKLFFLTEYTLRIIIWLLPKNKATHVPGWFFTESPDS